MKFTIGKHEAILVVVIIALVIAERIAASSDHLASVTMRLIDSSNAWGVRYGYLGVFFLSCFGNLTFVLIFPYTIVVFFLASVGLDPILLGIATGVGAELGELSGYLIGRSGAKTFDRLKPGRLNDLRLLMERRPKAIPWVLFIASFLPVPADIVFIPLGVMRYDLWKLVWPSTLGKVGAGLVIAFAGHGFFRLSLGSNYEASLILALITFIIIAVLLYAMAKIPWHVLVERTAGVAGEEGHERRTSV